MPSVGEKHNCDIGTLHGRDLVSPARRTKVKADKHPLSVGKIADNYRRGQAPDQGWNGNDLVAASKGWALQQVDNLDFVSAVHVLLTELIEVFKSADGSRRHAGDVKPQLP